MITRAPIPLPVRKPLHNSPEAKSVILNEVRAVKNPGKVPLLRTETGILRFAQNDKFALRLVTHRSPCRGEELEKRERESRAGTPAPPLGDPAPSPSVACTLTLTLSRKRAGEGIRQRSGRGNQTKERARESEQGEELEKREKESTAERRGVNLEWGAGGG
jgi:hypothetical protein